MAIEDQNKWKITPELLARARRIGEAVRQARIEFEQTPRMCPTHKKLGTFSRYVGAYTRGFAVFKCPEEGCEFQIG